MSLHSKRSLAGGELDPALHARVDMVKHATGVATMRNAYIRRSGGANNRSGSTVVGRVYKNDNGSGGYGEHRLIPFQVHSTGTTYVIEVGNGYLRPLFNGDQILESAVTIVANTGITAANPGVVTYSGSDPSGFANGDEIRITAPLIPALHGRNFKVTSVDTALNTFALQDLSGNNFDTTGLIPGTFTASFQRVYTIASANYLSAALASLQYTQIGDTLYINRSLGLDSLTRTSDTSWTLTSGVTLGPDIGTTASLSLGGLAGAAWAVAVSAVDRDTNEEGLARGALTVSTATAGTIQADAVDNASYYRFYLSKATGHWGLIAESASRFHVTASIAAESPNYARRPPGNFPAIPGVWTAEYPWTTLGIGAFPRVISSAQQRLWLAAPSQNRLMVYGSHLASPRNFTRQYPVSDDGTVAFELQGGGQIRHLLDLNKLVILTSEGEHVCDGNDDGVLTPTAFNVKKIGYNGAAVLAPVVLADSAVYLQEGASIVRELSSEQQGWKGMDLTPFSAHLFRNKTIVDWAYQKLPDSILWCVRSDGALLSLTYVKEHQIWGWARHDTLGDYKQGICCILEGTEYAVYYKVDREIDGETVSFIERMALRDFVDPRDQNFMDCSLAYEGRSSSMENGNSQYPGTMTLTRNSVTLSAVTQASPGVITYTGTDPAEGEEYEFSSVAGMTELNGNSYFLRNIDTAANTAELYDEDGNAVDTSGFTAYSSGGTAAQTWSNNNALTLTKSDTTTWPFSAEEVGNEVHLYEVTDGVITATYRLVIEGYTSASVVTVRPDQEIPAALQGAAGPIASITESTECTVTVDSHPFEDGDEIFISGVTGMVGLDGAYTVSDSTPTSFKVKSGGSYVDSSAFGAYTGGGIVGRSLSYWGRAVDQVSGLWHLEGEDVSVLGDGAVVASPNNEDYSIITVTDGAITLPQCFATVRVGLPYITDIETLDIDYADGESMADKKININQVTLRLCDTRGVWIGPAVPDGDDPLENMHSLQLQQLEDYDEVTELFTGKVTEDIQGDWQSNGRVALRQVDPVSMGVVAIMAGGHIPRRN